MPQAVACSTFFAFSIREIQSYSRLAKLAYRLGYIGLAENRRAGDDHVYARIDRRFDQMLGSGLLDEVRALYGRGLADTP